MYVFIILFRYLVKSAFLKKVGKDVPHFGVDKSPTDESDMKVYKVIKYPCLFILLQSFYTNNVLYFFHGSTVLPVGLFLLVFSGKENVSCICDKNQIYFNSKLVKNQLRKQSRRHAMQALRLNIESQVNVTIRRLLQHYKPSHLDVLCG
jgi:hypothetical protein